MSARRAVRDEWWRGAVVYQIYPRSFADSNNDGVGDLRASPSTWPTWPTWGWMPSGSPLLQVADGRFRLRRGRLPAGGPAVRHLADFDALIAQAHALGLKVMIDQVLSHTSTEHAWFQESQVSRDNPVPTGMSGPTRSPTARRPTTG
jgi:alpha-glucosidase